MCRLRPEQAPEHRVAGKVSVDRSSPRRNGHRDPGSHDGDHCGLHGEDGRPSAVESRDPSVPDLHAFSETSAERRHAGGAPDSSGLIEQKHSAGCHFSPPEGL